MQNANLKTKSFQIFLDSPLEGRKYNFLKHVIMIHLIMALVLQFYRSLRCRILLSKEEFFMEENCIVVENLSKSFNQKKVIDNLSFIVKKGEVFGLLGHNGAGKSTTIDLILGLKQPDSGNTSIFGLNAVRNKKTVFEDVGVQLQHTQYQVNITVEEICIEYSSLYNQPADYIRLLEQFSLCNLKKNFVSKLSGGEKQKLSVVLALIGNLKIVFLDELTTGLDVEARHEVWNMLKELKQQGLTIFLTTHYMEEAEVLCDKICILKNGVKIVEGSVDEVISKSNKKNLEEAYLFFMN